MTKKVYYVHANPGVMQIVATFLAAQGEIGGRETTELDVRGKKYPCLMIDGEHIKFVRDYVADNADIVTSIRLFARPEGSGREAEDVSFMLKKKNLIRQAVLTATATGGRASTLPIRSKIIRRGA